MWCESMTSAERMDALWEGERPDRVPVTPLLLGHAAVVCGEPLARIYDDAEQSFRCQTLTLDMYGFDGIVFCPISAASVSAFGGDMAFPLKKYQGAPFVTRTPVQIEDDVYSLQVPEDITKVDALAIALGLARRQAERGLRVSMAIPGPLELAGQLLGTDRLMTWLLKKPELVHHVLEKALAFDIRVAEHYVKEFGAERLVGFLATPTSSNALISPKQFETFALPYLQKVFARILELGVKPFLVHICGEHNKNLKYWQQVPMTKQTILSFGREVSLATVMDMFPDQIIAGNVDPTLIQEGKAEEVLEQSRECIETAKDHTARFILMAGCDVPPQAPPVNVFQLVKAAREYGRY